MLDKLTGILGVVIWLVVIRVAVYFWMDTINYFDTTSLAIAIVITIVSIMPIASALDEMKAKKSEKETSRVQVEVIKKEYIPSRTTMMQSGNSTIPIITRERFNVAISDGDHTQQIDSKVIYEALEEGDKFTAIKIQYVDKKGKVFRSDFELG